MLGGHAQRRRPDHESLPRGRSERDLPSRGGHLQDTRARGRRGCAQGGGGRFRGGRGGKNNASEK